MELQSNKACIITSCIGSWYPAGVKRLHNSLNFVGSPFDFIPYTVELPQYKQHKDYPYYFKIASFEEVRKQGYKIVLHVDASFWAIKSPMKMFDIINEQGYYFFSSGYNLAQSVNDNALAYVGLTRDDAEGITEWATGCVGINFDNPDGKALYNQWKEYMDAGLSIGNRAHADQSKDKRFLHHRQDQSAFSIAIHKLELTNKKGLDMVAYFGTPHNIDELIWQIGGI